MSDGSFWVYIISSQKNGTLYTGITSDLARRVWEHKEETYKGFSKKYRTKRLVYVEEYNNPVEAIRREKQIKKWNRAWKINLIESQNPDWKDLGAQLNT